VNYWHKLDSPRVANHRKMARPEIRTPDRVNIER